MCSPRQLAGSLPPRDPHRSSPDIPARFVRPEHQRGRLKRLLTGKCSAGRERNTHAHGTAQGRSRTEKPADFAASTNRLLPQMKVLLDGRCSHQIKDAASWRLSVARKEYLSRDCMANSRTWSLGRISLHPRLNNRRRATAPCLSRFVISLSRWRRQIAL